MSNNSSQGRSIRLFLVDGTPNGLLTGPRSKLRELLWCSGVALIGVYFLVDPM